MKIKELVSVINTQIIPLDQQEHYDNCGLIVGNPEQEITKILTTLDVNESVILEAIEKGCNLIIAHHPIIFKGLKTVVSQNTIGEQVVMMAIMADIAIYAAHTSLDNKFDDSLNQHLAKKIGLIDIYPLKRKEIGGAGAIGLLENPVFIIDFLSSLRKKLPLTGAVKYSSMTKNVLIQKIAICTGAGFFMVKEAKQQKADLFITSDLTYHNFFDEKDIILADIGHYESEKQASIVLLNLIKQTYATLDILESKINTNPVSYAL